jgi:Arc/MetJ-type ribon-helix-helix transcriptional regulator
MTNVIHCKLVAERAISVRLDAEAQRALELLLRDGRSQSEAIRSALIAASRAARYDRMEADAKRLADDPEDCALIAELQEFFGEV